MNAMWLLLYRSFIFVQNHNSIIQFQKDIQTQWHDSVAKVLYNNNVRFRQFKTSMLDRVNYRRVLQMCG